MSKFLNIGIATSVARDQHFSWKTTFQLARGAGLPHVQFYVDALPRIQSNKSLIAQDGNGTEFFFHLPSLSEPETVKAMIHQILEIRQKPTLFIVHQNYLPNLQSIASGTENLLFAVENDQPNAEPLQFLELVKQNNFTPVLDIPRFYHQNFGNRKLAEISSQIFELIEHLLVMDVPFLIHAIDFDRLSPGNRDTWCPLFEGIVPWTKILEMVCNRQEFLKSFILEYENRDMTQKSLRNLQTRIQ